MAVFMLRWMSNHVPRFRTLHTVDTFTWSILSSDMLILSKCAPVPITINSVLSSFSLRLSAVIQVLMSRMQSCNAVTASNSLALELVLNEIYNRLSSAYAWITIAYAICFYETVNDKWWLHKSVRQIKNGLKGGFVIYTLAKHCLNIWPL